MAIGLFGLEDSEHGMSFDLFGGVLDQPASGKCTPHALSRHATPVPLNLDSISEDPSHSDEGLFDGPVWFSEDSFGADRDVLPGFLPSAPASSSSIRSSELEFMSSADTDASSPLSCWADSATSEFLSSCGDSPLAGVESPGCSSDETASFMVESPRAVTGKREREPMPSAIPSGEAICAALAAAVPAIDIEGAPVAKRARRGSSKKNSFSRTSSADGLSRTASVDGGATAYAHYGMMQYMHPAFAMVYGAPAMYGAPMPFSRTCSAETVVMPSFSRTASASFSRTSSSVSTTRRGENVKGNPQMQKTARDGQKHWHDKCQQLRAEAEAAQTSATHPQFLEQRQMCSARNFKCQKESLIIFLQMATQQRLISPLPFVHAGDDSCGFVGWTGFKVEPGCGQKFREGVEGLFPEKPKLNTLYHLFRRSGLVPEDWRRAWDGEIAFHWNANRVS